MTEYDITEIAGLIYRRWTDAFETLRYVKKETDNGSPDWAEFHEIRLETAKAEEWEWNDRKNRFNAEHKAILNKMYGI